jgi:hypothetical protein
MHLTIILLQYMSKFHKTAYSRQQNFNAISSSHGRRNPLNQQPANDWPTHIGIEHPLERKVDIESALLINQKNQPRTTENGHRTTSNRSEGKFYDTSVGFTYGRERPQSKQEQRAKGTRGAMEGKIKTENFVPERPPTSKGVRNVQGKIGEVCGRQRSEQAE